jgi:hypothetical protein
MVSVAFGITQEPPRTGRMTRERKRALIERKDTLRENRLRENRLEGNKKEVARLLNTVFNTRPALSNVLHVLTPEGAKACVYHLRYISKHIRSTMNTCATPAC